MKCYRVCLDFPTERVYWQRLSDGRLHSLRDGEWRSQVEGSDDKEQSGRTGR